MIARILILLAVLSLIPMPVWADFYKYRDANGVLRFTDNLLDVPEDQREKIQAYKEVITPEPEPEVSDAVKAETALKSKNSRIEELNREREALEQSYTELEEERNALLKSPPGPQEQEAYAVYRKSIETFNAKIKSYEEERKLFQAKIDAFNAENETR